MFHVNPLCHKNRHMMTTCVITCNVIDNVRVNNAFSDWNNVHFEGDTNTLKSHDKQNLTFVAISFESCENRRSLVS